MERTPIFSGRSEEGGEEESGGDRSPFCALSDGQMWQDGALT